MALIDWNWNGHHQSSFILYAAALADLGFRVLPFCPAPDELPNLLALSPVGGSPTALARIEPPQRIALPPLGRFRPGRLRPVIQAVRHFGGLSRRLRQWERKAGTRVDLVFFACIYDHNFEWLRFAAPVFNYPWSGLYLHARSFRMPGSPIPYVGRLPCPERIFSLPSLHSVAVLDEKAVAPLRRITANKPVVRFPDLTDVSLPPERDPAWGLANKVREFARGRPVVSLLGHLQRTKGLEEFTLAAQDPSLRGLFFFLGGEVNWSEIGKSARDAMLAAWERSPNIYAHLQRIADERTFNAVITSSDVIYAAYTDFPNSSGLLSKAAFFERPVVVSEGYLMAERTREFGLGEIVRERDLAGIKTALRRLGGLEPLSGASPGRNWRGYQQAHSYQQLVECFANLLGRPSVWRNQTGTRPACVEANHPSSNAHG